MTSGAFTIPECPKAVAAVLRRLPSFPPSFAFTTALNFGLAKQLPQDVKDMLAGKRLRLEIRDAAVQLDFQWNGARFTPLTRQAETDLTISATGPDFVKLARREEDPDTLFFSRRLSMQGDTELGLVVKNTLDALELPVLHFGRRDAQAPSTEPPGTARDHHHHPWQG